ncbi:dual specificity phosphatase [Sodiomyces alkalinus F11]|uniref:Dual specificity phosphatase n=1 Tax=Sodiomyces alkalinus (strain CBS 110278 / VKM F-3762 / F11) TaxID=1314773 RepID=A0A3N2Q604_SODAK|nr:dual specificity phosphatase [Sodiomyces alkalinus F11]ROT42055.1 dual specificity phosphatase [Sodiomyces alkalinus F11]
MTQPASSGSPEEVAGWIDGPSWAPHDSDATDPKLLREHSEVKSYRTSRFTYPGVRVFYRRHRQAEQLPHPSLPLLVFVHGLGGSVAQFYPLLTSLVHLSSCLAIDLPGCGRSKFDPAGWEAYSFEALVELLEVIIEEYRRKDVEGTVVLIGHSLGSAFCARLASHATPERTSLSEHVVGLVGICPPGPLPEEKVTLFRRLLWTPGWLFDLWRAWDRRGGPYSASVTRFVGKGGSLQLRKMQDRFNTQSRTPVWRRVAWGTLPTFEDGIAKGGMSGEDVWAGLNVPVFLVAGEDDHVTSPNEVKRIEQSITKRSPPPAEPGDESEGIPDSAAPVNTSTTLSEHLPQRIEDIAQEDFTRDRSIANRGDSQDDPSTPQETPTSVPPQPRHPAGTFKAVVMPSPANHALLYMPATVRILSGLISDFLQNHVSGRLSLGWQLQYLSREGKWDVKNFEKWRKVAPVSAPIGRPGAPVFRAMKTLREADDVHSPAVFVKKWGEIIRTVIDISHDQPVYDPLTMEKGGVSYHKFATVSKIPPRDGEVDSFIQVVDRIRSEKQKSPSLDEGVSENEEDDAVDDEKKEVIGVHCHYGFNRTGYFLVCYLVERCGFEVQEAIDTFAAARPNGIRHSHFLDHLFVRYSGLSKGKDRA